MAPLQRFAASTLRSATRPALSFRAPALVRYETAGHNPGKEAGGQAGRPSSSSTDAPTIPHGQSDLIRQEGPVQGQPNHNPDYNVAVDYRSSYARHSSRRGVAGKESNTS